MRGRAGGRVRRRVWGLGGGWWGAQRGKAVWRDIIDLAGVELAVLDDGRDVAWWRGARQAIQGAHDGAAAGRAARAADGVHDPHLDGMQVRAGFLEQGFRDLVHDPQNLGFYMSRGCYTRLYMNTPVCKSEKAEHSRVYLHVYM